jgi:hypothetical protein
MSRLSLIWDGAWLTWTTFKEGDVGRREISRPDMVPEVLRALRNQVGAGAQVVHGEWGQPATAMPQAMLPESNKESCLAQWHELHHGLLDKGHEVFTATLEELMDAPQIAVASSGLWQDAVDGVFPQARHIPLVQALIHDVVTWNRGLSHEGWSFRVDVREQGAVLVAAKGEALQWVHHLAPGLESDDVLYAMVNAAHRSGADVHQARVRWSGSQALTVGWDRFLHVERVGDQEAQPHTWLPLLQSMMACA